MRRLVFSLLLVLLAPATARAQELSLPEARQGYYIGGGLRSGVGFADNENVGDFGALTHFGVAFRFGQKTLPWLSFGLVIPGGAESNEEWSAGYGGLLLEAQLEPFDFDLAFRLSVGVGGGSVSREIEANVTDDDPEFFFGSWYMAGVSYDWFPFYSPEDYDSGGLALTLFAEGRYLPGGDVNLGGAFVGIEITWWSGLPKQKLELPVEKAF